MFSYKVFPLELFRRYCASYFNEQIAMNYFLIKKKEKKQVMHRTNLRNVGFFHGWKRREQKVKSTRNVLAELF